MVNPMKYRLVDLLACPMCKNFPLKLTVFRHESRYDPKEVRKCELYCAFHVGMVSELPETNCLECYRFEIIDGVLQCERCMRWYPIIDEIPIMLPDELRSKSRDFEFLKRWRDVLPENIIRSGKPYGLVE